MERPTATVSPLRRRMTDDMRMRKFEPKTQAAYLRAVTKLGTFLKRSPDTATADDLRASSLRTGGASRREWGSPSGRCRPTSTGYRRAD